MYKRQIEYLHPHRKSVVSQREIMLDTQNFAHALRAALRQAPDVIMLGEMRDFETMQTAITASETGHLLISSLHTLGAVSYTHLDVYKRQAPCHTYCVGCCE